MAYVNSNIETVENEKYTEDDYLEMLNESYGTVDVCGFEYDAGDLLLRLDPIAFHCGFADFQEYETKYLCPICGEEHDEEQDALDCCPENWIDDDDGDEEEEAEE